VPAQILALLALEPGQAVPTTRIVDRIWAPDPPERAAARLHVHVSRIRRTLAELGCPDALHTRNDGYALDIDPAGCDHVQFERETATGLDALRHGDPRRAAAPLSTALGRWRGPVLGELGDRPWAQAAVARLTDLRRQATDAWARAHLTLGEHALVVPLLEQELADDPLRESRAELLMTALYRGGRQADALAVYTRLRDALADELGLDPSPALHGAYLAILRHDPALAAPGTTEPAPSAPHRPASVAELPPRISTLVGRAAELVAIEEAAAAARHEGPHVVVLVGLGGVGKSRLALEAAHRAGDCGEIAWWIPAGGVVAAVEALGQLARALGVADHADQTIMLARLWDELRRRDRWTLVYDDCPNPEAFVALRPPAGTGTVLVTSRHRGWGRVGRVVAVDVLDNASSVHVLTSSSGDDNPVAAAELAEQMGGLPLALVQAAAFVEETGMTLAQYAGLFRRRRLALLSRAAPDDHAAGVAATWDMSLDQIALRSAAAADLLELCAALGPARVPLELLAQAAPALDGPLADVVGDELLLEDTIAELLRFSVVFRGRDGLRVHPLLRAVVLGRQNDDALARARLRADQVLARATPADPDAPATWSRWAWWVPHALDLAGRHEVVGDAARAVPLLANAARYLSARALFLSARDAAQRALVCATAAWGNADPRLVPHQTHLGLLHERLGDLSAARHLQEEALALLRSAPPCDPLLEAVTLMRLGGVLACQRDLPPALDAFQQALAVLARVDAPHETGRCLTEVALVHWMSGHLPPARARFERAIAVLDGTVGPEHPDAAHARSGLAIVLQDLGRVEEAYALQSQVVAAFRRARGPVHPDVAHAYDKLAYMAGLLGRHRVGLEGHACALAILQDIYGPDHVELAMPLTNMGVVHLTLAEVEAAGRAQERARQLFAAGYGAHHPHTALATWRLGVVRARQHRCDEAAELLAAALDDTVAGLGPQHPDVARISDDLAACRVPPHSTFHVPQRADR
jgi:DNA-binding SARP family transcriptional activator/tetratricopeptide (TPR) repeat protein